MVQARPITAYPVMGRTCSIKVDILINCATLILPRWNPLAKETSHTESKG